MPGDVQLAFVAATTCGLWFLLVGVTYATGFEFLPFVRTAVPALWLGVIALVAAFPPGRLQYLAVALLLPGFAWAVVVWTQAVSNGNWQQVDHVSRNDAFEGTPATIRDVRAIGGDRIVCSYLDSQVCGLVAPNLEGSGVTVSIPPTVTYRRTIRCALGTHRQRPPWQVLVYRKGNLLGVLCD